MGKKFLSAFAIAYMLLATSCSNEDLNSGLNGTESNVTFTAQLPAGLQSRSFGDGTTANTLSYAVYLKEGNAWTLTQISSADESINMTKPVSMRLVNGNTYQVVFWADAAGSRYTFDKDARKVTVDYNNVESSVEALDAFYAVEEITVSGASSKTIPLKRPFAQLNIGTADLAAAAQAGLPVAEAGIKVKAYKTLNFDGTVSDLSETEVIFDLAQLPAGETFPVSGNDYLTMNYLLMPADKKADNTVTIFYDNAQVPERTFNNVPLQRNYRTNIYGNLLTSGEDFNVVITPGFDDPAYKVSIWDGTTVTAPAVVNNEYQIETAAQFVWLSKNQGNGLAKDVKLLKDIDLGGNSIQQMRVQQITFNGNGHTISNFVLNSAPNQSEGYANGLFSTEILAGNQFTVKDLTVKNVKVDINGTDYAYAGTIISDIQNGSTILLSGVTVDNADVCGMQSVGGLVGFVASNSNLTVENCTVKNSYVHNYALANESGFVAGLVGRPLGNVTVTGSTVENTIIDGYYALRRGENSIAAVVGTKDNTGATVTNVTVNKTLVDNNVTYVSTMAELKDALPVRVGGSYADGGTIVLANDIDMTGWTSVNGTYTNFVLDGAGHSLKNLTTPLYSDLGVGTYKVCNLNFENVNMNMTSTQLGGFAGALVAEIKANNGVTLTIENCNINNSLIHGYKYAGGFIGYTSNGSVNNEATIEILNSTVNNTKVSTDDSSCGGLIGHDRAEVLNIKGCKVTGATTIKCAENRNGGKAKAGYLVGTVNSGITTIANCTVASSVKLENTNAYTYNAKAYVGRNEGGTIND